MGILDRFLYPGRFKIRVNGKITYGSNSRFEALKAFSMAKDVEEGEIVFLENGVTMRIHCPLTELDDKYEDEEANFFGRLGAGVSAPGIERASASMDK